MQTACRNRRERLPNQPRAIDTVRVVNLVDGSWSSARNGYLKLTCSFRTDEEGGVGIRFATSSAASRRAPSHAAGRKASEQIARGPVQTRDHGVGAVATDRVKGS